MKYKGIIFDMDGTLLNTLEDIGEATNRVLASKNLPLRSMDEYKMFVGEGAKRLMERAIPASENTDSLVDECLALFFKEYNQTWNNQTELYPGIGSLLDRLEALSLSKSILSNKPDDFTKACAAEYLKNWKFDKIMGSNQEIPRKPDPTGAKYIAEDLKISPEEIIFVGDTKIDMQTALGAGMTPIGVLWGFRSEKELADNGAKSILKKPMELLDLLR